MPVRKQWLLSCCAAPQEVITCGQPSFLTVFDFPICTAVWHFSAVPLWHEPRFACRTCSLQPDLRPGGATLLLQSTAQRPVWMPLSAFQAEARSLAITQSGASGNEVLMALP